MAVPISNATLANAPNNVKCPSYDRASTTVGILHIGVGNFHRSHQALYVDDLLASGVTDWAICGVGIRPSDREMYKALTAQDCLYTLVEKSGSSSKARIIGSMIEYIYGCDQPDRVFERLTDPAIRVVTLTVTEGGYYVDQGTRGLDLGNADIIHDLQNPLTPKTVFGYLAEGLNRRRKADLPSFTVLSCDNVEKNGDVAKGALTAFCRQDPRRPGLADWIEQFVSFPNCMVDRITPATTQSERDFVRSTYNLLDAVPVVAEPFRQWVIEDKFRNGRPPLEMVDHIVFTSDVAPYEKMKIRLLNGGHSAMGYLGYLRGHRYIHEIAKDPEFIPYLMGIMDIEVTPLLGSVPGVNLADYKLTLMERFGNERIKDQALRICMDGSAKMPKFILPSISEQILRLGPISRLTFCTAGWIRFLNGTDEQGNEIPIVDAQGERLRRLSSKHRDDPLPLLACTDIFGDLGKSERFVAELKLHLNHIYDRGVREALSFVNESETLA